MTANGPGDPGASTIEAPALEGERPPALPSKVLHIALRMTQREPESFALNVIDVSAQAGIGATVVSGGGPLVAALNAREIAHEEFALETTGTLAYHTMMARLTRRIRRQGVKLVHAHGAAAPSAVTAARRCNVPVVVSLYALPREPQARRRLLAAAAQADAVIAAAGAMLPALAAEGGVAHDRIAVVPPGLDLARFHPSQVSPTLLLRLARRWRLPDHAPVALLPTALQPGEGHELAVEALAWLDERPLHLVLLGTPDGDQDHIKALLRFADDRGVGHRVCVVDDWDELPTAAILAETLLVTSPRLEMADEALAVAQAMGRPVVALDHHGVAGLPSVGSLTWLSPSDSPAALAQALRAALDLPEEERLALAPAGIEGVRDCADRAAACQAVLEVYAVVLARADAPGRPAEGA